MIIRTIIVSLLFILCNGHVVLSQTPQPTYVNFSARDGLPSSEVYSGLLDRNGYLWFSTDRGVVRYNGYEFTTFTTVDGLIDNVVFEMYEDSKGRIWFLSMDVSLCYIENGKIVKYKYNKILREFYGTSTAHINSFFVDSKDNVCIGSSGRGLIKISKDGKLGSAEDNQWSGQVYVDHAGNMLTYTNGQKYTGSFSIAYKDHLIAARPGVPIRIKSFMISKEVLCVNYAYSIILYNTEQNKVIDEITFDHHISSFTKIDDLLFVGLDLGGLRIYSIESNQFSLKLNTLDKYTVSTPVKDKDGGYWIPTIEHGIFYTPNFDVLSYTQSEGLIRNYVKELTLFDNELMVSFGDYSQAIDERGMISSEITRHEKSTRKKESGPFYYKDCMISYDWGDLVDVCTKRIFPCKKLGIPFVKIRNDTTYLFTKDAAFRYSAKKIRRIPFVKNLPQIQDASIINANSFWIGTVDGLYRIDENNRVEMARVNKLFSYRVVDLDQTSNYGLIVATRGAGVLLYKDKRLIQLSTKNGLVTDNIICLYVDKAENIWVGTTHGLHRINATDYSKIDYYSIADGLLSNEITDIKILANRVYVGTKRGLSVIDLSTYKKQVQKLTIGITEISLDGIKLEAGSVIDIYTGDKYLEINYLTINYFSQGNIEYKYRILGLSDDWHYTKERSLTLETFPESGKYIIEIYARVFPNGEWCKDPVELELIFHAPYYKTWTFRIAVSGFILLIIYLAFKFDLLAYNKHIQQELSNRLLKRMGRKSYLLIDADRKKIRIDEADILFIQSFKDYVEINTSQRKFVYRSTMKNMETLLTARNFIRVHRSFIVRKDKIDAISKVDLHIQSVEIPIGRTYQDSLLELRAQFSRLNN